MIDDTLINSIIKSHKTFKLGARGIALVCSFNENLNRWRIRIDRASCLIYADTISAVDDVDYYVLEMVNNDKLIGEIDLIPYTKITVIE